MRRLNAEKCEAFEDATEIEDSIGFVSTKRVFFCALCVFVDVCVYESSRV